MNSPLLTLPILAKFVDLIIGYQDFKQIDDNNLLELIKLVDERKRAIKELQFKLAELSGLEEDKLLNMALSILHKRKVDTAKLFNVDIENIPDCPVNYIVIDGSTEYKL